MKISRLVIILLLTISCNNTVTVKLENPNYLNISDSIKIKLDSLTFSNSYNIQLQDSVLMIKNEVINSLTFLDFRGHVFAYHDFSEMKEKLHKFNIDGAWFTSLDSIYVFTSKYKMIYLFNNKEVCIDSLSTTNDSIKIKIQLLPNIYISTIQQPYVYEKSIYTTGFSFGEGKGIADSNRFVVRELKKGTSDYFVNYPLDYANIDWGGIYYRMAYSCIANDSLMYISFPASDFIAILNLNTKKVKYQNLYPQINKLLKPFHGDLIISAKDKFKRAKHYYGQYSFKGIIYDKYRKVFHRFLILPTEDKNIERKRLGIQRKYLLTYDHNFNYLGFTELNESVSSSTFFVTKKGLLIKNESYQNDEDNLYFYLYSHRNDN